MYPMLHQMAFYEGDARGRRERDRSPCRAPAGPAASVMARCIWSGDIASTFEALQTQVRAGLNVAMSGIPWWTTDIGGFHDGDIRTDYFKELIVRWFQFGVFCPIFRLHGSRGPNNGIIDQRSGGRQ